ncbi:Zinc finger protein-likeDZIP1 [Orchesella cincta]|uniref:Zinc finger protein-likeDZIP1 n=1 Tax=Orchesella cincta TaxID=48709 RepID=A0A1D2N1R7_ORCCI|nr:Zinc finger protein-likeDZIP1 [Orchesella cincta]
MVHKNEKVKCSKKNQKVNSSNFQQYALQALETDTSDTHKWLDSNGTLLKQINMVCVDCRYILETHENLRLKLENIQQKLKRELETLYNIMKMATKVPSRVSRSEMNWKDNDDYNTFCSMRQTKYDHHIDGENIRSSKINPKTNDIKVPFQLSNPPIPESKLADNAVPKISNSFKKEVNMKIKVEPVANKDEHEKYCETEDLINYNVSLTGESVQPKKNCQLKETIVQQRERKLKPIFTCETCHRTYASNDSLKHHKDRHCSKGLLAYWKSIRKVEKADQCLEVSEQQTRFPESGSQDESETHPPNELVVSKEERNESPESSLSISGAMGELQIPKLELPNQSGLPPIRRFEIIVNDQRTTVVQCNFCHVAFLNQHFLQKHVKAIHVPNGYMHLKPQNDEYTVVKDE